MKRENQIRRNDQRYVIIGDELPTVRCLEHDLRLVLPEYRLCAVLRDSVAVRNYPDFPSTSFALADVELPDGDSISAIKLAAPGIPVLFFGEYENSRYDFQNLHVMDYLLKPIGLWELQASLAYLNQPTDQTYA